VLRALGNQGMNDMSKPERAHRACLDPDAVVTCLASNGGTKPGLTRPRRTLTVRA
jgi:hypothetical protein